MHDLGKHTIVVTGAAGLIGSALIWALNRRGLTDILAVDRLDESEKWRHLVPLRFNDYLDADDFISAAQEQPGYFGEVGTVFHLGACSSTTERDSDYLMRNNYEYTKALAQWALDVDARFVYASSAATYGALEDLLSDEIDVETLRPLNMYAYSKQLFDLYAKRSGMNARIAGLKYFNVFGPNEDHKGDMRSVVCKAYDQIRDGGGVKLFKSYRPEFRDGEQRRDFIYVKDAVEMTIAVAESSATGLVNIGSGLAQTWLDLVRPIFAALALPERVEFVEMPEGLRPKYQYSTQARIDRLRACGYSAPITPLADAVRDYVTNYLVPARVLDPAQQPALSVR
ncbi:MAG TPA: ADP-glyceromanno-heptose 6-epimerase [Candidatus Acidoferrales bacterium]|nr:ADP-glyceromanno-heptose 6-epimerase [Candidatus Acidoferrales bacterium]